MIDSGRKQITIQIYPDRHPVLYKYLVDDDGQLIKDRKPSQEIPSLADRFLAQDAAEENQVIDQLNRIEALIKNLKSIGLIDDDQETAMRIKARKLKAKAPVSR